MLSYLFKIVSSVREILCVSYCCSNIEEQRASNNVKAHVSLRDRVVTDTASDL